ncbi:unnamed protein product [Vitrella brassicaformis CCMP3155]|uniref:IQCH-like ATP-grasp domain-containing protein n=4 Tax=Vitrella brassicaformis TaxID=1169539 RepID=A0A0G4FZ77_VITBC|nr:unnamed protein product [Vitrella brassicaformis CCMP3155]|eukprot:CEM20919.1 unnamed protein product [Vitrella brassicaformis CCMP3155]
MAQLEELGKLVVDLRRDLQAIQENLQAMPTSPSSSEKRAGATHAVTAQYHLLQATLERADASLKQRAEKILQLVVNRGNHEVFYPPIPDPVAHPRPRPFPPAAAAPHPALLQFAAAASPLEVFPFPSVQESHAALSTFSDIESLPPHLRIAPLMHLKDTRLTTLPGRHPPPPPQGQLPATGRPSKLKQTKPKRFLPKTNKLDPLADPPSLTENDLQCGLLDLAVRGFLPHSADVTPAMERGRPVIHTKQATLHPPDDKREERYEPAPPLPALNLRLDPTPAWHAPARPRDDTGEGTRVTLALPAPPQAAQEVPSTHRLPPTFFTSLPEPATPEPGEMEEREEERAAPAAVAAPVRQLPAPHAAAAEEGLRALAEIEIVIRNGHVQPSVEYQLFKKHHHRHWGAITQYLQRLETMFSAKEALVCKVHGGRLASLASDECQVASDLQLMGCVVAFEATPDAAGEGGPASSLRRIRLQTRGHRAAISAGGKSSLAGAMHGTATTIIGSWWKMRKERRKFIQHKKRIKATNFIREQWGLYLAVKRTRKTVFAMMQERQREYKRLLYEFGGDWPSKKSGRRLEVHVPSVAVPDSRKETSQYWWERQNAQLGRLFRVWDPSIDVVYVTCEHPPSELLEYFYKIMTLRGIDNPQGKIQIVVAEEAANLPRVSLTTALLCSPKAIRRIRTIAKGRFGYIVPGHVSPLEVQLSSALGLPLFGPPPTKVASLSTKSEMRRVMQTAQIPSGPHATNINQADKFYESLSVLIMEHPEIPMWVFKIDDETSARGTALIDMSALGIIGHLKKMMQEGGGGAREEGQQQGGQGGAGDEKEPWSRQKTINMVAKVLVKYVPKKVQLCDPKAYPTWTHYFTEYLRVGGVIEGCPPGVIGRPSVHLRVDPDGSSRVLATTESVQSKPLIHAFSVAPQTCASYQPLADAASLLGRALAARSIIGFITIDFVVFETQRPPEGSPAADMMRPSPSPSPSSPPPDSLPPSSTGQAGTLAPGEEPISFAGLKSPSPDVPSEMSVVSREMSPVRQEGGGLGGGGGGGESLGSLGSVGVGEGEGGLLAWVVDIDVRMTDDCAMLFFGQAISQALYNPNTGVFDNLNVVQPSAEVDSSVNDSMQPGDSALQSQPSASTTVSFVLAHCVESPPLCRLSLRQLFQVSKAKGFSYDLMHNHGVTFTYAQGYQSLLSFLLIAPSPPQCLQRLMSFVPFLADPQDAMARRGGGGSLAAHEEGGVGEGGKRAVTIGELQRALRHLGRDEVIGGRLLGERGMDEPNKEGI